MYVHEYTELPILLKSVEVVALELNYYCPPNRLI